MYRRVPLICILAGVFPHLGGTVLALLTAVGIDLLGGWLNKILARFSLRQKSSFMKIFHMSLLGLHSHLLGSFLHEEMKPFYPITSNPILGVGASQVVHGLCVLSFFPGLGLLGCE